MGVTPLATRHASCAALVVISRFAAGIFVDGEVSASPFFFVEMSRTAADAPCSGGCSASSLTADRRGSRVRVKSPEMRNGIPGAVLAGRNLIYKELP